MSYSQEVQFIRNSKIAHQTIDGKTLLLNPKKSGVHELNETATFVWQKIECPKNVSSLVGELCREFQVGQEQARFDIEKILNDFKINGLLA